MKTALRIAAAAVGLLTLIGSPVYAASPQVVPSIAALRAGSFGSYPTIELTGWYAGSRDGGGKLILDSADTTTADNSCTVFVDVAGKRFKRPPNPEGVAWLDCGAKGDGTTNDSTAVAAAQTAIRATSRFGMMLGEAGKVFRIDTFPRIDIAKEGVDCKTALIDGSNIASNATYILVDSTDANPYPPREIFRDCPRILGPSGGSPGTTGTGMRFEGTLGGSVAHISLRNVGIAGFHNGQLYSSNAYLIDNYNVSIFQNDDGVVANSGCTNCGENIRYISSAIFNNTRLAVDISNPNASLNIIGSSIDYNQTVGAATLCQVSIVDAAVSITSSHIEDETAPVNCITASGSTPALTLTGNTYVRTSGASSRLITAGNGGYVSVNGGTILAAVSPQTTIGAEAGGYISVDGLTMGSAAFDTSVGTYRFCPNSNIACSSNRGDVAAQQTTNSYFYAPNGYTVATLPTPFAGLFTYVTDANAACTKNVAPTGGGAFKCPVWYDGAGWVQY